MSDIGYRTKVYSDIWYNVGLGALQSDVGRSDIRLSPISLITDIGLSAHLRRRPTVVNHAACGGEPSYGPPHQLAFYPLSVAPPSFCATLLVDATFLQIPGLPLFTDSFLLAANCSLTAAYWRLCLTLSWAWAFWRPGKWKMLHLVGRWRKLYHVCHRDTHDISCHVKENGYPACYYKMCFCLMYEWHECRMTVQINM